MNLEQDIGTRVSLLEVGQREIVHTLGQMREDQKNERKEISDAFDGLRRDLSKTARPFPFKEVGATITVTIAVMGAFVSGLNFWFDARSAVLSDHVSALERVVDPKQMAVMEYRLSQLEALAKTSVASK